MDRKEAIKVVKGNCLKDSHLIKEALEILIPELKESEDEKIRKEIIEYLEQSQFGDEHYQIDDDIVRGYIAWLEKQGSIGKTNEKLRQYREYLIKETERWHKREEDETLSKIGRQDCIGHANAYVSARSEFEDLFNYDSWLEKQGEQKPKMIQWKGDNLIEVVNFTGISPKFNDWFKTWEEFEAYVHKHNNIFKLFNKDGSHYEVPVDAWIVKTPDGYNVPSKAKYKQKIEQKTAWSEEDEIMWYGVMETEQYMLDVVNGVKIFDVGNTSIKEECTKELNWLKSLKPQQKQEWSEEDEKMLERIIKSICISRSSCEEDDDIKDMYDEEIDWLKSLKGRMKGE